jgi:cytoskeleton protein RodZ
VTFFQRIRTPFAEGHDDEQARMQPRMRMIGEHLQERREDLGLDLDEIGAMLRIKPSYLAALEQGRTQDLPGPTYAIGFVRAYAEFLGLDAEPVLARFKAEASGVTARPDLALPVPLGERSLPGGALVLVALILALCGYGIWYYLSTDERNRPERVAAVPASLQPPTSAPVLVAPPAAQPDPSSASPAATAAPGATPQSSGQASAPPTAPAKTGDGQTPSAPSLFGAAAGGASPNAAPPVTVPPGTASTPSASSPSAPTLAPGTLLTPMSRAGAPPPQATTPAPAPAAPAQAAVPASPQTAAPPQTTQTAATPPQATTAAAPANSGATASAGRVAIRALADCWIQVRATDQTIVFSRVLKSGEVYNVPARSGLSLRTGNAGALQIDVDGKTAPSIGSIGTLRRDVSLDPAELAAGTAVHG